MTAPHTLLDTAGPKNHFGPAWHRRVAGLHVLKLKGSFYDMGVQHGTLLREDVARGPIPHFRTHVERLMGRSTLGPAGKLVWPVLQSLVGRRAAKKLPSFAVDSLRGIAEGAQLDPNEFLDGCTMPDSLLWLASRLMQVKKIGPAVHHRLALGLGCTSAIAWGDATRDGMLLHARNLDYHGVGTWPSTAAVIFYEPEDGMKYVAAAAAGVALGGFTAMNEAGLSLTVHQHMFTDRARLGGTPIGLAGDLVMRHARNLDDAERILSDFTPIGCWTYLVTDAKTREVLCWEENPERHVARRTTPSETTFGYANIYLDPALGETELNLYGSYWRHNQGRFRRVHEMLAERAGTLDPQSMAEIIGDRGDPRCRIRDAMAMVMTVASVVFRPEDGTMWLGTGQAPTSRSTYIPFSLHNQDIAPPARELRVGDDESDSDRAGYEAYRKAYVAYLEDDDPRAARALMADACDHCPEQPLFHFLHALAALQLGEAADADRALTRSIRLGHPDEQRVAAFHLWRGRARDMLDQRDVARRDYRSALGHAADPPVHRAAQAHLDRAFHPRGLRTMNIDFSLADVVTP